MVLLLKQRREINVEVIQRAADDAFRDAPAPVRVIQIKNGSLFGLALGPMLMGLISAGKPYFRDVEKVANQTSNFAARQAIFGHTAWIGVDLVGDAPGIDRQKVYELLGRLVAEFLQDDVLGLIRLPSGPIVGYDFSFIPLLRNGKVSDVFEKGPPDRIVKTKAGDPELVAATAEAMRRWPEFTAAFAARQPRQGFGVKKAFLDGEKTEHMWVTVTGIEGQVIRGRLCNKPQTIHSLKFGDLVEITVAEVEDWMYTMGKENIGGFQAKVLEARRNQ